MVDETAVGETAIGERAVDEPGPHRLAATA